MCRFQEGSNVFSTMTAHDQHITAARDSLSVCQHYSTTQLKPLWKLKLNAMCLMLSVQLMHCSNKLTLQVCLNLIWSAFNAYYFINYTIV